jgi:hypothetical protein
VSTKALAKWEGYPFLENPIARIRLGVVSVSASVASKSEYASICARAISVWFLAVRNVWSCWGSVGTSCCIFYVGVVKLVLYTFYDKWVFVVSMEIFSFNHYVCLNLSRFSSCFPRLTCLSKKLSCFFMLMLSIVFIYFYVEWFFVIQEMFVGLSKSGVIRF